MTISERLLRRWRKEALKWEKNRETGIEKVVPEEPRSELVRKILRMTQELLDLHLVKGK